MSMGIESTAINDLIGQVARKSLPRDDEEDWMFGEAGDATEIDPVRDLVPAMRAATPPRVLLPMPVRPSGQRLQATQFVRTGTDWRAVAKFLALPLGLFAIVIVLLGVYFAKQDSNPSASPHAVIASAPSVTPIETAPVVTPIEPAPRGQPVAAPVKAEPPPASAEPPPASAEPPPASAEPPPAPSVAPPPAPSAAPPPPAPSAEPPPNEPPPNVEPGSPASRFLNAAPAEPTIRAGTIKPTVAAAPAISAAKQEPEPTVLPAAKAKPVAAKAKPKHDRRPAKVAKTAKRATKVVAKRDDDDEEAAAPKPKSAKQTDDDDDATPVKAAKTDEPAKPTGKGVLSLASTPPLEVWVDGRNSNANTPLRVILLAGKHKVTLFDKDHGKAHSFEVEIEPNETLKVTRSY